MSDYIERQAVIEVLEAKKDKSAKGDIGCFYNAIIQNTIDALKGLLSADVVQVIHGKWMKEDRGHVEYCAVCDQCGFDWMWSDRGYFKFCPNCGAKMRGEQE